MPGNGMMMAALLLAGQQATGIGSGVKGPGAPADMPVSVNDAPGTPGGASRNPAVLRKVTPERVAAYSASVAARRAEAETMAVAARSGRVGADAAALRTALQEDMEAWRGAFNVAPAEWKATVPQWLADPTSLTAAQWAQRRADWFASRDQWIALKQGRKGR